MKSLAEVVVRLGLSSLPSSLANKIIRNDPKYALYEARPPLQPRPTLVCLPLLIKIHCSLVFLPFSSPVANLD